MSESTTCPFCAEEIKADARKCKHCGEWIEGVPPMSPPPSSDAKAEVSGGGASLVVSALVVLILTVGAVSLTNSLIVGVTVFVLALLIVSALQKKPAKPEVAAANDFRKTSSYKLLMAGGVAFILFFVAVASGLFAKEAAPPQREPLTISPGIIPDVSAAHDIAPQALPELSRPSLSESQQDAVDAVTAAFDLDNKLGVRLDDLRVKDNPNGEGSIVYVERTNFFGLERYVVWMVVDSSAFALNSPSQMVTPSLPWPREAKDGVWEKTGIDKFSGASEVIKMIF